MVGGDSGTILVGVLLYGMVQSLIAWLNGRSWHRLSTIAPAPCLRAWTQLTYFFSFSTSSVSPLHFALSSIFYFAQCPQCQGGVNNSRVFLVYCMRNYIVWLLSIGKRTLGRYGLLGRSDQTPPGALHWTEHTCHHIDSTWSVCQRVFRSLSLSSFFVTCTARPLAVNWIRAGPGCYTMVPRGDRPVSRCVYLVTRRIATGTSGAWTIGTKGPWPPSKFGSHKKMAILPPWQNFSAFPESKRGPLTFFQPYPPLWRTSRRHWPALPILSGTKKNSPTHSSIAPKPNHQLTLRQWNQKVHTYTYCSTSIRSTNTHEILYQKNIFINWSV